MHPSSTRSEFLRLRVQGVSFASISRQLGVSKPTLIAWSRQLKPDPEFPALNPQPSTLNQAVSEEVTDLQRKLTGVKQELFSRSIRECPTEILESIAGKIRARIEHLESMQSSPQHSTTPSHETHS